MILYLIFYHIHIHIIWDIIHLDVASCELRSYPGFKLLLQRSAAAPRFMSGHGEFGGFRVVRTHQKGGVKHPKWWV